MISFTDQFVVQLISFIVGFILMQVLFFIGKKIEPRKRERSLLITKYCLEPGSPVKQTANFHIIDSHQFLPPPTVDTPAHSTRTLYEARTNIFENKRFMDDKSIKEWFESDSFNNNRREYLYKED